MSSSCCNGNCGCGSDCKCASSCSGCKRNPDLGYSAEKSSAETVQSGVGPEKPSFEASEMSAGAENDGCKCAPTCSCNPYTCK